MKFLKGNYCIVKYSPIYILKLLKYLCLVRMYIRVHDAGAAVTYFID